MSAGTAIDIVVIALLALAIGYGFLLSRKLNALSGAQAEFTAALAAFDEATRRAEATLKGLEAAGIAKGVEFQGAAGKAERLINELAVMTSAGERIAVRIENAIGEVRAVGAGATRKTRSAA